MTEQAGTVPEPELVLSGLRDAIAGVLDDADLNRIDLQAVHNGTPLLSLPIDSMALMEIMTKVEDTFRVYIPEAQAYKFTTVGEVVDFVRAKAAAKAARQQG